MTRSAVENIIKQSREEGADELLTATADAIVAIGYYTTCLQDGEATGMDESIDSRRRLSYVLGLYSKIQHCPSSLLKLQVSVTNYTV